MYVTWGNSDSTDWEQYDLNLFSCKFNAFFSFKTRFLIQMQPDQIYFEKSNLHLLTMRFVMVNWGTLLKTLICAQSAKRARARQKGFAM